MRQLAVVSILGLLGLVAHAKELSTHNKKMVCADPKTIIEGLTEQSEEQPFWNGVDDKTKYILFLNAKTGTWSLVQYNNRIACVLGVGKKGQQIFLGPGT